MIIAAFLLHGAHLVDQIQNINNKLQSQQGFTKENINDLSVEMQQLEYFIYLFMALISSIVLALFPRKQSNKICNQKNIENLKKIKKRANVQNQTI